MNRLRGRLFAAVGVALATVGAAAADPITVHFEGVGPGSGSAGQYNWNSGNVTLADVVYTPNGNGSPSANHFVTFCIERTQYISGGSTYSNYQFTPLEGSPVPGPAMPAAVADAIRSMWAEYRGDLDTGTAGERADKSAAFQEAVWHLLDPKYGAAPSTGHAFGTAAVSYYDQFLDPTTWHSGLANLMVITSPDHQDQLVQLRGPGVTAVDPVPAPTALLTALVLAPGVWLRRRMARKTVVS